MVNCSENKLILGKAGEDIALRFLINKGFKLIKRNFRIRSGEIDLIMQHGNTVVFVEVRTKSSNLFGTPIETINAVKRAKIVKTAQFFIAVYLPDNDDINFRFDVIGITLSKNAEPEIVYIENAFAVE